MKHTLVIFIITAVSIMAQENTLTLEQSLKLGFENSKELKIAKSKMAGSDAKISEANSQLLPQLKFQASYQRLSSIPPFQISLPILPQPIQIFPVILDNYNLKLSLQQPLFTGFRLLSLKRSAKNNYSSSSEDYEKELNETAFRVQNAFWNLYKAIQLENLLRSNLDLTQKHLDDTKSFLIHGLATQNDLLRLQVQYSNTQLQLIEAENNVDIARSAFNQLLGLPMDNNTNIDAGQIDSTVKTYTLDGLITMANQNRHELKSLEYKLNATENGVTAANSGWYPSLFFFGDYYYSKPNQRIIPAQNIFKDTWDLGITLQWDLWNWGYTSSQAAQAEEQKVQVETSLSQLKDAVSLEVYQALLTYNRAADKISVSRLTVEQANENYRATKENYNQQVATSTDLVSAEVSLLQAQTNFTTSLVDYQISKIKLIKAAGEKIY